MSETACPATTKVGKPCRGWPQTPAGYCNTHKQQDVEYWSHVLDFRAGREVSLMSEPAVDGVDIVEMETAAWQDVARVMLGWAAKLGDESEWGKYFAEWAENLLDVTEADVQEARRATNPQSGQSRCGAKTAAGAACRAFSSRGYRCRHHRDQA